MPRNLHTYQHHNQAAIDHVLAYEMLSFELGPIVDDVRNTFFELSDIHLKSLLMLYRNKYGNKPANYALEAYPIWKSGERKMSGQTAQRLLDLIPKYLTSEQRFQMVKKLCEHHAKTIDRYITVDRDNIELAFNQVNHAIETIKNSHSLKYIPDNVLETVKWLNDADIVVSRSMLSQIDNVMHQQVKQSISNNMTLINSVLSNKETKNFHETFKFPNGTITLQMTDSSYCFVATEVYGGRYHPNVIALRAFRDKVLVTNTVGIQFVNFYYRFGANFALIVKHVPGLSTLIRWSLDHLVNSFNRKNHA